MAVSQKLNDKRLENYMQGFYGYGSNKAHYWFIGKEEHSDGTFEDTKKRIEAWHRLGEKRVLDLFEYHNAIGKLRCFGPEATLGATWKQLIRIYLTATGQDASKSNMIEYQRNLLGRRGRDSDTRLLEFLPLPNPGSGKWGYRKFTAQKYLWKRTTYKKAMVI